MTDIQTRFKKFGGDHIPDIVEYLKENIEKNPSLTISVGCDSIQKRRKTMYAITLMIYDTDIRNGAHVIFFRENLTKLRDNFERLQKEAEFALEVANYLHDELSPFYRRQDLTNSELKRYKYHLLRSSGQYSHVAVHNEDTFINNLPLSESEKLFEYKLVDIHLDYNPFEGNVDKRGVAKNRSNMSYKSYVPYLRSIGYRVFCKSDSPAASSAADLLLQD